MVTKQRWRRALAYGVAAFYTVAGVDMIWSPASWYGRIPGVVGTGPFNPHFVRDIGLAFFASALAFFAFAHFRWPSLWPAALAGSLFPLFHALFHLLGHVRGHATASLLFELSLIVLPASLALGVALPRRGPPHQEVP